MSTTELPPDPEQDPSEPSPEEFEATKSALLAQLNDLIKHNKGAEAEIIELKSQVVGLFECNLMTRQALVELTQKQLDKARLSLRLSIRAQAGLLSPEERAQLDEM